LVLSDEFERLHQRFKGEDDSPGTGLSFGGSIVLMEYIEGASNSI
jgi:hypothetical protein